MTEFQMGKREKGFRSLRWLPWGLLIFCLTLSGCGPSWEKEEAETGFFAMNTLMTFTAYGENAQEALSEARAQVERAEGLWSVTDENSEIWQANHSGGKAVPVSEETARLVSFALGMAQETDGALDPTVYPVLAAWGFTTQEKRVPQKEEIDGLIGLVDHEKILLDGNLLTVPEGMALDFGAVAKGYAGDLASQTLRSYGIESAILSLGGNVQTVGGRPDGSEWRIGIRSPWEDGTLGTLRVRDCAVVTSGGYENYFTDENGNIYWHILDPDTGYPADTGLVSVTVICQDGRVGDALSTALFVMGAEKAEDYWREAGNFEMILVTEDRRLLVTEEAAGYFRQDGGRREKVSVLTR